MNIGRPDAAIDLNVFIREPLSELSHFRNTFTHKLLSTLTFDREGRKTWSIRGPHALKEWYHWPGWTVITNNISAAFPMSSVMAVEGVLGEIAIPAFIPLLLILAIRDNGSAARIKQLVRIT
jgi:hypothetical protein